jgi:hypothetical protein
MSLSESKCYYSNNCLHFFKHPVPLGLNEAGTLKSSSTLIYSHSAQSIYTQSGWQDAVLIKEVR